MSLPGRILRLRGLSWMTAMLVAAAVLHPGASSAREGGATVTIGGSGGALGGMTLVAEAFRRHHPDIEVKFLPSLGSGGGIKALLHGSLDLALSARPLTEDERRQGATAVEYARTPLVFAAADGAPELSLTRTGVASIYGSATPLWPDGAPMRLVLRPASENDIQLLRGISPEMDRAVQAALSREGMLIATTDQDNADMLAKVKGAFGVVSLAQIVSEKRRLRQFAFDGVMPGVRALAEGRYPLVLSKSFYAVTGLHRPDAVRAFLDFLLSSEGRDILTRSGHLVIAASPK